MKSNNSFAEKIYSKKSIEKIRSKVSLLGVNSKIDAIKFMNTRLILSIIIFIFTLFIGKYAYITAPLLTILFYLGIEYLVIDVSIKKRISKLDYEALFFFEVLTLSLETGRNLKGALELTVKNIDNELSNEFKTALDEVTYGKTLNEALNNMKLRMPSEAINNVLLNITQSNIFGNSIISTLYNQVDYLRDKKILEVRSIIAKMPIKMSIVSVLFFVPLILLLLLGPVIIELL